MPRVTLFVFAVLFFPCASVFAQSGGGTIPTISFDPSNTTVQGVPFDVPVKVKFSFSSKPTAVYFQYVKVPREDYRRLINSRDKDALKKFWLEISIKPGFTPVTLLPKDSVQKVSPTDATYTLTLNLADYRIYLDPNANYTFALITPFLDNSANRSTYGTIFMKVALARTLYLQANPAAQASFAQQEQVLADAGKSPADRENAWLYIRNAILQAGGDAAALLGDALQGYLDAWNAYLSVNRSAPSIPYPDRYDTTKEQFYQVYNLVLSNQSLTSAYVKTANQLQQQQTAIPAPVPFVNDSACARDLLHCAGNGAALQDLYLKDTTGIWSFLFSLSDSATTNSITRLLTRCRANLDSALHQLSFFQAQPPQYFSQLAQYRKQFARLKDIIFIARTCSGRSVCPSLANYVTLQLSAIDAYMGIANALVQARDAFMRQCKSTDDFISVSVFGADSYVYSATTRQTLRLSSDIGVIDYGLNPWFPGWITPYAGVHINFRYISPDVPLSAIRRGNTWKSFTRHASAFIGITIFSVQQSNKTQNLFGKSALLVGLGYRVTNAFRIVAGSMIARKVNPNPLIANTTTAGIPFVGLSFDTNSIFQSITSLLKQ